MKRIKQLVKRSFSNLNNAAGKRAVKLFANKYHFVYFGHVDPQEDEYELVRGLTVSASHQDNHYTVGTYNGHDIILVERRNTLTFPGRPDSSYRWLILQIDLVHTSLPHVFIDCRHHDAVFYANAFMAKNNMQDMSGYFSGLSAVFNQKCKLFASPAQYQEVGRFMRPEIAETLAAHFSQFDYEFFDDRVLVYASNRVVTLAMLEDMLRIGGWLAEQFNAQE